MCFKVKNFVDKREILQANSVLKNHENEVKSKVFMTPDLTQKQRATFFKLREELRYRKNVLNQTNLKISKGRIVSSGNDRDTTQPSEEGFGSQTGTREFLNRTFVNKNLAGGKEGPPRGERPFPGN